MSKLQTFLDELSDRELVSFYVYRYEQFLKGSKERIDAEITKRGITKRDMTGYLNNPPAYSPEHCPRCGSSKFYTSTELETVTYSYASVDLEVDYKTCLVCLYAPEKEMSNGPQRFVGPFGFIKALVNRKK